MKRSDESIKQVNCTPITAFGPVVLKVEIASEMIDKLNAVCDIAINEEKKSWSKKLVGQLKNEWLVDNELLVKQELYGYLCGVAQLYAGYVNTGPRQVDLSHFKEPGACNIQSAWVNEMKKYEYNPAHYHTNCILSSVLYLEVPDFDSNPILKNPPENKRNVDGCLEFLYGSYWPGVGDNGNHVVDPKAGDFYIFPSHLQHTVYPFGCEGIRRSMAINFY